MAGSLKKVVCCLHAQVVTFLEEFEDVPGHDAVKQAAKDLLIAVEANFELAAESYHAVVGSGKRGRRKEARQLSKGQLAKKVANLTAPRSRLVADQKRALAAKLNGRINVLWSVRVGLADPNTSSEAVEAWVTEFPPEEARNVSRGSVPRIRDCWVELVKYQNRCMARDMFVQAPDNLVVLIHTQDEANMRVRSSCINLGTDSRVQLPMNARRYSRSPRSSVQVHSMVLAFGSRMMEWHTELQPLERKTAATLATAVIIATEEVMECLVAGVQAPSIRIRFLHLITGDGINTNEAAMRIVLHWFIRQSSFKDVFDYKMACWKCGAHKASLVVKTALCGRRYFEEVIDGDGILGATTRLYKYLVPDYADQFAGRLRSWVVEQLAFEVGEVLPGIRRPDWNMRLLYGQEVLPDRLCDILNVDCRRLVHVCAQGESQEGVRGQLIALLYELNLRCENHPVPTRFWVFGPCVRAMLRWMLLGIPETVLTTETIKPRQENLKRLTAVKAFLRRGGGDLRRACLCLRLTDVGVNLTASKHRRRDGVPKKTGSGAAAEAQLPTMVRLGKGEVQRLTIQELARIVPLLHHDADLNLKEAVLALFVTMTHVLIRFDTFLQFPTSVWLLSEKYNPVGYVEQIERFLVIGKERPECLDVGFSFPLYLAATTCKESGAGHQDHAACLRYLTSPSVQGEILAFVEYAQGTSLDAERQINQDRAVEKKDKVMTCARASRNAILKAYRAGRVKMIQERLSLTATCKREMAMNSRAVAMTEVPEYFQRGRGRLWWEKGISDDVARRMTHAGDQVKLNEYLLDHGDRLRQAAKKRRDVARADRLAAGVGMPITNGEWVKWVEAHSELYEKTMAEATDKRQQAHSGRLKPMDNLASTHRLQPVSPPMQPWVRQIRDSRANFYVLKFGAEHADVLLVYAAGLGPRCYGFALQWARVADQVVCTMDVSKCFSEMTDLETCVRDRGFVDSPSEIRIVDMEISVVGAEIRLAAMVIRELEKPERKSRRQKESAWQGLGEDEDDSCVESLQSSGNESLISQGEDSNDDAECTDEEHEDPDDAESDKTNKHVEETDDVGRTRKRAGENTAGDYKYFTLTRNPQYPNVVMRMKGDKWAKESELGTSALSKTCTFNVYDGDVHADPPEMSMLAARAWMLFRARHRGWHLRNPPRTAWYFREQEKLRSDVARLTLTDKAAAAIGSWAPEVLAG